MCGSGMKNVAKNGLLGLAPLFLAKNTNVFDGPKTPDVPTPQAIPQPAPTPTIQPSEVSAAASGEARRKRLEQLRYGFASTIKTGAQGVLVPDSTSAGKTKLG
jgi:hypothetical protein